MNWTHFPFGSGVRVRLLLRHVLPGLACLFVLLSEPKPVAAEDSESIAVFPGTIELFRPGSRQRVVVEKMLNGRAVGELTNAVFSMDGSTVARVENGVLVAVAPGAGTLSLEAGGHRVAAAVHVGAGDSGGGWSFRNHVQPVLARAGCSSGACHGAAAGQNGLRLSLRGYDDEGDFLALTRHARGRRIVPSDPGQSLLLLKATGTVPHKGGVRFTPESLEYAVLSDWIAAGTPGPSANDHRIQSIEVLPRLAGLKKGETQQLLVRARFDDGHVEDVTHWAKFSVADGTVAQVDESGRVTITGQGESAISAWYLSRIALATVTVPYTHQTDPGLFARAAKRNFIDEKVLIQLERLGVPPSPRCTDSEFIRRAFLDAIGMLPTSAEVRTFLADSSADKRDRLIEHLLARPEYVDYWTYKWSDLLLVQSRKLNGPGMWAFHSWIRKNVEENTPWDEFARRIVTAKGGTLENGAANFYLLHEEPRLLAENTSLAFLGMSINCARCHNHPLEKWTNEQYFKFANLFARVRTKAGNQEGETVVFEAPDGDIAQPLTGRVLPPTPLDGDMLPDSLKNDRRAHLANWLVSPANPYFSKAIANRVWANFFGIGLVMNVDDLRVTNPASNPELLDSLADQLAAARFDIKFLIRSILQSETYQRSSEALPANAADTRHHARYYPKRLMAEVMLDAVSQVSGEPTEFSGYPKGWRALQLPDANVDSYFLKTFGRPERERTCECERTSESSVSQILHLANGGTLNKKLSSNENHVSRCLDRKVPAAEVVEEAFYSALSRPPSADEKERLVSLIEKAGAESRRAAIEDLYWALLSSKEFLFNH